MSWQPTADPPTLRLRSEVLWKIRRFFHEQGMDEVQTPVLGRDTVVDRHLEPIRVPVAALGLERLTSTGVLPDEFFLQTSPEFNMKRLLAAGLRDIYQICPAFRAGERGRLHNPEFTMVEWYRVGDDMEAGIDLLTQLVTAVTEYDSVEQVSYRALFEKYASCDPLTARLNDLISTATTLLDVDENWSQDKDDWLDLIFAEVVQPSLGTRVPMVVTHYPSSQCALARVSPDDARSAERFELFIKGIELANGYHELTDARELTERNRAVNHERERDGKRVFPDDSSLLDAMQHGLPNCSGCALGLDRLLIALSGAESIDEVIAFPIESS